MFVHYVKKVCLFLSLTLHYDVGSGVDGVYIVAGVAGVLASVILVDVLDIKPSQWCDADARVAG